jgi:cytochrome c oxidase subunit 3
MWLFLATEVLFFGGLILCWIYSRHWNLSGFDAGARETALWIGTLNTAILITSSLMYAMGLAFIRVGNTRRLIHCCVVTLMLGLAFLALKFGLEWRDDFAQHLFPAAADFKITGAQAGGARLFYVFYFISTLLHGLHMLIGVALLMWIILRARRGEFSALYHTPVHVVGLYWSFVDIVWITLYPLIYLVGRG